MNGVIARAALAEGRSFEEVAEEFAQVQEQIGGELSRNLAQAAEGV